MACNKPRCLVHPSEEVWARTPERAMGGDMVDREHGVGLTESDWILLDPSESCWIRAVPSRSEADRL